MKTTLISIAVGTLLTAIVAGQAASPRPSLAVGYVNVQRAMAESAACRLPQCVWSRPALLRTKTSHKGHSFLAVLITPPPP